VKYDKTTIKLIRKNVRFSEQIATLIKDAVIARGISENELVSACISNAIKEYKNTCPIFSNDKYKVYEPRAIPMNYRFTEQLANDITTAADRWQVGSQNEVIALSVFMSLSNKKFK